MTTRQTVTGIGGIFFRTAGDPLALAHWYRDHLGVDSGLDGDTVWTQQAGPTILAPFPADTTKFDAGQGVMLNFRAADLDGMLAQLRADGVAIEAGPETDAGAGRFAWIRDPDGNLIELWEPGF